MIVPVKKVKLAVLNDYQEDLLQNLQRYGILMLIPVGEDSAADLPEDALLERTEKSLRLIKEYQSKKEQSEAPQVIDYEEFVRFDENRKELLLKIETYSEEINNLKNEIKNIEDAINFYLPWKSLPIELSLLGRTRYTISRVGFINPYRIKSFVAVLDAVGGDYLLLDTSAEGQAVAIVCYYTDEAALLDELKNAEFHEVILPSNVKTPAAIISEKKKELAIIQEKLNKAEMALSKYSESIQELELLSDQLDTFIELKQAPIAKMPRTVYLEGWVRADRVDILKRSIQEVTDIYDLEITDADSEETPPTVMENKRYVEPFETITEMFSVPDPYEADPNPALSFWFVFLFGMMMGDVAYGIIIAFFSFLYIKLKKPKDTSLKLLKVFLYSGLATVLWGAAFGSYFGFTLKPNLIEPINDPLKMLIISLIVGGLHIITGILIKAYSNIRNKRYLDAVFDQFSWIFILIGAGMLFIPDLNTVGSALALTGGFIILLTGGRKSKGIFGKVFGGLGGLYNITSYLSDILSYSRILALCLSTATIGWVMNMLAGMFKGSILGYFVSAIIFLIGHSFNIVMGILSAYVHDSRLQYIEFFNQFYQGGGYEFKPLALKLKYIDKVKVANLQGGINYE